MYYACRPTRARRDGRRTARETAPPSPTKGRSPMPDAYKDPAPVSREALRREADREIVGLLRRNHDDNQLIIALLMEMVALLKTSAPLGMDGGDTGF